MEGFDEKASQIRQLAALPVDQLSQHLANTHNTLASVAPNLAPHVHSTAINAIQFLNSKLPPVGNELLGDTERKPSEMQQKHWLDLHSVVNDPISILDHAKNQRLNNAHLDAVKTVYPDLHREMVEKIQEQAGKLKDQKRSLPYSQRLSIAKLSGMPIDSTMTPMNMQAIIQSAGQNTGPQAQAQRRHESSGAELNQINKVNQLDQTQAQAREAKRPH